MILSNIPGLIDMKGTGEVVPRIEKITPQIEAMADGTNAQTSVGGMISKLSAAKIAQRAGCAVIIGSGRDDTLIERLLAGESVGTYFVPSSEPIKSHKRWIAIQDHTHGTLHIDSGATTALVEMGKSLLAAGVTHAEGDFHTGDLVDVSGPDGTPIARGVVDLDAEAIQGYTGSAPIIHRDHLVLL